MNRFEFNSNLIDFKNKQDELAHYGTRGQKWGVRKWQNYDGTFNEAGKERYFGKKNSSSSDEKMGGLMSSMLNRAAKKADKMQEKYVNKWNNNEEYRNKMINKNVDIMKNHKSLYGMDGLTDDEVEKLTKAIMKKGVADIYEVRNEAAKYKADKNNYFNDIDLDDMQIHDYVKTSEVAKDHPMFSGEPETFGSYGPKKSDNPDNKYQNEDGTLTQKGYKKFVMSFMEDMDITTEDYAPSKEGKAKYNNDKFWEGETKRRVNLINDLLNDDSLNIDKELKSDIKNKNTRKNLKELIEYCKENGIDKVTDEMIEGVKAGQNYLGATERLNNIRSQMEMFGYDNATIASYYAWLGIRNNTINNDKNISKFKENNKNYKEYKKLNDDAMSKYNDTAQEKLIELLEKELGHKVPTKVYNPQNGTRALDMEKAMDDPKIMEILGKNFASAADYANNDKSVIDAHTKAYRTLQKAEGDTQKYLEKYLCSNATKTVPGTTEVNLETGEVSESSIPSAMAYTMYADDFRKYEHD